VKKELQSSKCEVRLPVGILCGNNCADGCRYYEPRNRDSESRGYCNRYGTHYYPSERNGCFSYAD
jgi:hypothetical protein